MTRRPQRILAGTLFALFFANGGVSVYRSLASFGEASDPGWRISQRGGRVVVASVKPAGAASALRPGDEIVALNGEPVLGALQAEFFERLPPGSHYAVAVRRDGEPLEFTLRTEPLALSLWMLQLMETFFIPAIFFATGFAVFLLRPDDKQALLLALMFGMFNGLIGYPAPRGLPWAVAVVMVVARAISSFFWPLFLHFFLIFPEPSPALRRFPRLEYYLYLPHLLLLLPYFGVFSALTAVSLEQALAFAGRWPAWRWACLGAVGVYVAGGLLSLVSNYRQAGRASRGKLRVVVVGSVAGFIPPFLLVAASLVFDLEQANQAAMQWVVLGVVGAFALFPLSFAYAIVRHQVIPVRLIIRRGVRYVLVSRGSVVLELIVVALVLTFVLQGLFRYLELSRLVVGIWSGVISILVWGVVERLHRSVVAPAIDRRFFRRSYDAQQILSELGQALGRLTDMREMTRLASRKIQDALQTESVTIFLRDERAGDYVCAFSSEQDDDGQVTFGAAKGLILPHNAFVVERLRESAQPLAVDFDDPQNWVRALDAADKSRGLPRWGEGKILRRIRAALLLPVGTKAQLFGIVSLGPRLGDLPFSRENRQLLMAVAWQMALVIENAQLVRRRAEEERLRAELEFATEVQQRLFPSGPPESASLELSGVCHPASEVGGDYYDFLALDGGRVGIAVADVSGKGISAALLMSAVQASLRSQAVTVRGRLTDLVASMNRLLCRSTDTNRYATFFYAQFDEATRELTYVNAGHNPPILVRARHVIDAAAAGQALALTGEAVVAAEVTAVQTSGGAVRLLETGGPVIGLIEDCCYEHETVELRGGDVLVAYTDGVSEALNPAGEEFGEARLKEAAAAGSHLAAEALRDQLIAAVRRWSRDAPQHDDMTLVVMKVR